MLDQLYIEIERIKDQGLRDWTRQIADAVPVDSWKLPTSRDHHVRDECGEWGNLIHTVRVTRICNTLSDILDHDQINRDILRSAAALHDICKHGIDAEAVFIYREHPQMVKQLIDKLKMDHKVNVETCIEQHMGRWGSVACNWQQDKKITLAFLLHVADCIEARLPEMTVKKNI